MIELTFSEISAYYQVRVPAMAQPDKGEWRGPCPVHDGKGPNFSVKSQTGFAHCHSQCNKGWDVIGLEMALSGCDFATAKAAVFSIVGRPAPTREDADIEACYDCPVVPMQIPSRPVCFAKPPAMKAAASS